MNATLLLLAGWVLYFTLHSLLAADAAKALVARRLPRLMPWYRLLYNAWALLGLGALAWLQWQAGRARLWPLHLLTAVPGALLLLAGLAGLALAFRAYDAFEFAGWPQPAASPRPSSLQTSGFNRYVRHPLYTATLLLFAGYVLLLARPADLGLFAVVLAYIRAGIWLEERKLIRQFGDIYRQYAARTPMLIPRTGILRARRPV
ncbi:MAG: isoprenylcysteine carboxylmethyltransferase family protein [Bacteroidia bacterium]|nr:isoprenylcysteine carboxylmethyltransferase family protein [Bacteroidia bacterium]